jgi:hypothetical protein
LDKNLERIIEGLHKELFNYILPVEEVKPVDRKNSGKRSNDWDLLDPERSLDEIVVEALKTVVIPSSRRLTRRDKRPFVTSRFDPPMLENICLVFQLSHDCSCLRQPSLLV